MHNVLSAFYHTKFINIFVSIVCYNRKHVFDKLCETDLNLERKETELQKLQKSIKQPVSKTVLIKKRYDSDSKDIQFPVAYFYF